MVANSVIWCMIAESFESKISNTYVNRIYFIIEYFSSCTCESVVCSAARDPITNVWLNEDIAARDAEVIARLTKCPFKLQ